MKRSNTKRYSAEFRLRAVKLRTESGYSLKAVAAELGMTDTKQIRDWIQRYKAEGLAGLEDKSPKHKPKSKEAQLSKKQENELEYLRAENALLHYLLDAKKKDDTKRSVT